MRKMAKTFTITKKISRHGKQAVIVIPKFLQDDLKPKTVVEVKITTVKEAEKENV
jgi:predicted pyridoxine 5'-phosphate oxidase superfamily flavin-nucleotide-binding protein